MSSRLDERIASLQEQLKQAKAKKAKLEARQRAQESKRRRAADTRRKILVGAAVLARVERGEWPEERLREMLAAVLTRADDRALFGLPPLPAAATEQKG